MLSITETKASLLPFHPLISHPIAITPHCYHTPLIPPPHMQGFRALYFISGAVLHTTPVQDTTRVIGFSNAKYLSPAPDQSNTHSPSARLCVATSLHRPLSSAKSNAPFITAQIKQLLYCTGTFAQIRSPLDAPDGRHSVQRQRLTPRPPTARTAIKSALQPTTEDPSIEGYLRTGQGATIFCFAQLSNRTPPLLTGTPRYSGILLQPRPLPPALRLALPRLHELHQRRS